MSEQIYRHPDDYDLEHEGDDEDVAFCVELAARRRPARVMEMACGTGRITVPLAEAGAQHGWTVTGIEIEPRMLDAARQRASESPDSAASLELLEGDMRSWESPQAFDLILSPCSSMCHLLTLADQLASWRAAYRNLAPGGLFVVDVPMPDPSAFADSFRQQPRERTEIDRDSTDPETGDRLIRWRTTAYAAHEQRARYRYLYDLFRAGSSANPERRISDYEAHVYYPRELQLLFLHTGFELGPAWGDYRFRPLARSSERLILTGSRA